MEEPFDFTFILNEDKYATMVDRDTARMSSIFWFYAETADRVGKQFILVNEKNEAIRYDADALISDKLVEGRKYRGACLCRFFFSFCIACVFHVQHFMTDSKFRRKSIVVVGYEDQERVGRNVVKKRDVHNHMHRLVHGRYAP